MALSFSINLPPKCSLVWSTGESNHDKRLELAKVCSEILSLNNLPAIDYSEYSYKTFEEKKINQINIRADGLKNEEKELRTFLIDIPGDSIELTPDEFMSKLLEGTLPRDSNIHVLGDLIILGDKGLSLMPDNVFIEGNFFVVEYTGEISLPNNLTVSLNLFFSGYEKFVSPPKKLSVGCNAYFNGCINLASLPEDFFFGGYLDLEGCTALTSLPKSMTELVDNTDENSRRIDLTDTGISEELIRRLTNLFVYNS